MSKSGKRKSTNDLGNLSPSKRRRIPPSLSRITCDSHHSTCNRAKNLRASLRNRKPIAKFYQQYLPSTLVSNAIREQYGSSLLDIARRGDSKPTLTGNALYGLTSLIILEQFRATKNAHRPLSRFLRDFGEQGGRAKKAIYTALKMERMEARMLGASLVGVLAITNLNECPIVSIDCFMDLVEADEMFRSMLPPVDDIYVALQGLRQYTSDYESMSLVKQDDFSIPTSSFQCPQPATISNNITNSPAVLDVLTIKLQGVQSFIGEIENMCKPLSPIPCLTATPFDNISPHHSTMVDICDIEAQYTISSSMLLSPISDIQMALKELRSQVLEIKNTILLSQTAPGVVISSARDLCLSPGDNSMVDICDIEAARVNAAAIMTYLL